MTEIIDLIQHELELSTPIDADTPLVSSGLVDSFAFPVLLSALESRFGVRIGPDEIGADNFDTPAQMLEFVRAKQ